jgi:hypothetical protein
MRTAKDKLRCDDDAHSELKDALKRLKKSQDLTDFVKSTDWKQRCTLLFELIYQHFDGRETAEELIRHEVIDYLASEVTEDFGQVFEAIQAKYPHMHLNSAAHGYLIHVQNLIKEERDFEYPDEIVSIAGSLIIGKFKGFVKQP